MSHYIADIMGMAGFGMLVYGVALIHGPAAWIVAGVLLGSIALVAARSEKR
jgi:hypothetical protein